MTERRTDEKEEGDKEEPAGLWVHAPVYLPDCDILADEESDRTAGFIPKQPLDQTQPVQELHGSAGPSCLARLLQRGRCLCTPPGPKSRGETRRAIAEFWEVGKKKRKGKREPSFHNEGCKEDG